uniref:histone acetyltransferase n=1 Tax=Palpitomonas bilix TaxID=652834 RepID=A0A7S3GFZ5_9EUKA
MAASKRPPQSPETPSSRPETPHYDLVEYKHGAPLDIGWTVLCKAGPNGAPHMCSVVDRKQCPGYDKIPKKKAVEGAVSRTKSSPGGATHEYDYYVHFHKMNSRLDRWVHFADLDTSSVGRPRQLQEDDKKKGKFSGRKRKRGDEEGKEDGEEDTKVKNISTVRVGRFELETWYYSPYPADVVQGSSLARLFVCEYCLSYTPSDFTMKRHLCKCPHRHPPGDEIYRDGDLSVFEVDGKENKAYCQSLCLLAKLFLDHKTLYYDVDPFKFYILTEVDARGCHFVGYFSKEKESPGGYNLACIMTLPCYQKQGYGHFLIELSYELSRKDCKVGTPERPLSDLGVASYRSYWKYRILEYLSQKACSSTISISNITEATMIQGEDVVQTLQSMGAIQMLKGQHVVVLPADIIAGSSAKGRRLKVDPSKLVWTPTPRPVKEKGSRR